MDAGPGWEVGTRGFDGRDTEERSSMGRIRDVAELQEQSVSRDDLVVIHVAGLTRGWKATPNTVATSAHGGPKPPAPLLPAAW